MRTELPSLFIALLAKVTRTEDLELNQNLATGRNILDENSALRTLSCSLFLVLMRAQAFYARFTGIFSREAGRGAS